MFEPGKSYFISMWSADGVVQHLAGVVILIEMPLVKFRSPAGEEVIINTSSRAFVGAKVADEG